MLNAFILAAVEQITLLLRSNLITRQDIFFEATNHPSGKNTDRATLTLCEFLKESRRSKG